jgi:uncharacterized protein YlxW (UPF0749 family)
MDLVFKILAALFGFVSVAAALYNVFTAHTRARQRDHENRQAAQLEVTTALAIRTQERVTSLESRVGSFEQRVEKRLDQIADDVGDFKEMFTKFLINHLKS